MPQTLYLVDGHAQIFRAYYAPFGNLSAPDGEPTRATHVFCQMLLNLVRDRQPDYLAVALDVGDETTFRRQAYPDYKAHREPPPEDFPIQEQRILSILETMRLPLLRAPGYEADDIIATLVRRHASPDLHVYIVSRDKDLDQLLGPHVSLFDPMKGETITPERLFASKGWWPNQAIEAQILTGDSVDNVPGVVGIGPKTAAKLIAKYGTAQAVVEHADELTPKQRENVLAFAPQIEVARNLLSLCCETPIGFELDAARIDAINWQAARPIFEKLNFRRLLEQLPGDATSAARENTSAPADEVDPAEMPTFAPIVRGRNVQHQPLAEQLAEQAAALREPDPGVYTLVDTPAALQSLAKELANQPAFCVDTETSATAPNDAKLTGIALAWETGRGFYIPLRAVIGTALPLELVQDTLGPIFANATTTKIGHNIKYDLIVLRRAGLPIGGPLFDTMIAAFVLDPTQMSYKLDKLVQGLLGHEMIPITDLIGRGRQQMLMEQVRTEYVAEYAAEDADYTWRLSRLFETALVGGDFAKLFFELEMPLVSVLAEMEFNGIKIDTDLLKRLSGELATRVEALAEEVCALASVKFNLDSPKQLAEVLFDRLGYRIVRRTKTTRSTDADTLETLARETGDPLPTKLLEYRELQKLRGTYLDALPKVISPTTGRVHTCYSQTSAITGRLASSEPNLQNIPVRTALGRQIRGAFVPADAEHRLIVADYSQIELRVLAHFCEDEGLIRAFQEDRDIHAFVAAQVNHVALEDVTREMRAQAKAVNFGLIYGQTAVGLAQVTGMSRAAAQAFIREYFARYPRIRGFIDQCIADAKRDGYVQTIYGRRRPILDIDSRNRVARAQAERLAVNTVIQGSAADLIKLAMVRLDAQIRGEALPLRMLLQVHDELVCEAPTAAAEAMATRVAAVMSGAMELRVPLKVDVAAAESWLDAK